MSAEELGVVEAYCQPAETGLVIYCTASSIKQLAIVEVVSSTKPDPAEGISTVLPLLVTPTTSWIPDVGLAVPLEGNWVFGCSWLDETFIEDDAEKPRYSYMKREEDVTPVPKTTLTVFVAFLTLGALNTVSFVPYAG